MEREDSIRKEVVSNRSSNCHLVFFLLFQLSKIGLIPAMQHSEVSGVMETAMEVVEEDGEIELCEENSVEDNNEQLCDKENKEEESFFAIGSNYVSQLDSDCDKDTGDRIKQGKDRLEQYEDIIGANAENSEKDQSKCCNEDMIASTIDDNFK